MSAIAVDSQPASIRLAPTGDTVRVGCRNCGARYEIPSSSVDFDALSSQGSYGGFYVHPHICPSCASGAYVCGDGQLPEPYWGARGDRSWYHASRSLVEDDLADIEDYDSTFSRRLRMAVGGGAVRSPRPDDEATTRRWRATAVLGIVLTIANAGVHPHLVRSRNDRYLDRETGRLVRRPAPHVLAAEEIIERSKGDEKTACGGDAFRAFQCWARLPVSACLEGRWADVSADLTELPIDPRALFEGWVDSRDTAAFHGALEVLAALEA